MSIAKTVTSADLHFSVAVVCQYRLGYAAVTNKFNSSVIRNNKDYLSFI